MELWSIDTFHVLIEPLTESLNNNAGISKQALPIVLTIIIDMIHRIDTFSDDILYGRAIRMFADVILIDEESGLEFLNFAIIWRKKGMEVLYISLHRLCLN